ncbi:MAG: hypothetical protein ACI4FN_05070 [Acutalibacteraceae bacterium]
MKMQESVLRRVRMVEEKNGIKYAKTDGKLYKTLRMLYSLVFIYTVGINLLFISGMLLVYGGTDKMAGILNSLISVCACTALIIAGYVLSFFKFKLAAGIMSVIPEIFLIPVFGSVMRDSLGIFGFSTSFYWRHLIPLAVLIILMTATTVIAVRARLKTEKLYKKVTDNLFEIYHSSGNNITDGEWEEFLKNFDPTDYKRLFKESERKP